MATADETLDNRLIQIARELLATRQILTAGVWATHAGVSDAVIREQVMRNEGRCDAIEKGCGARWVESEGGFFLVK
jgi:hypothetical protein